MRLSLCKPFASVCHVLFKHFETPGAPSCWPVPSIIISHPCAAVLAGRSATHTRAFGKQAHRAQMGHGPATFKETDLTRALRAARKAGADVERVEVGRDGRIILVLKNGEKVLTERNEWDE
jgi:hypothetical protein